MTWKEYLSAVASVFATQLSYLYGGWTGAMSFLVTLMVVDYTSGVMCGLHDKNLSSEKSFRGLLRKIMILFMVLVGRCCDYVLGVEMARDLVIYFYIANECLSIIENAGRLGVPIPGPIKEALEQVRKKGD